MFLRRCLLLALMPALCLLLAGCASDPPQVTTAFDPLARFPAEATYVWDDAANEMPKDPRFKELDFEPILKEVAQEAFAARGYRLSGSTDSQYLLSYELEAATFLGPDASRTVGSLWLFLRRADNRHRVWAGSLTAPIYVGLSDDERRQRLRKELDRMLKEFPPSQRGG